MMRGAASRSRALAALGVGACLLAGTVSEAKSEASFDDAMVIGSGLTASAAATAKSAEFAGSGLDIPATLTAPDKARPVDPWRSTEPIDPWPLKHEKRAAPKLVFNPQPMNEIVDPWAGRTLPAVARWSDIVDPWALPRVRRSIKKAP
jgi:hypothetical protein